MPIKTVAETSAIRYKGRVSPVEKYLQHLNEIRASGSATDETSYYTALHNLLDEVGKTLKPRVRYVLQLKDRGAGHPDGGLFTPDQFQRVADEEPIPGQRPARGAVEVKSTREDAFVTADGEQVTKYWREYGQVLVTNYRDFVLVVRDADGKPTPVAPFRIAPDEKSFWKLTAHPQKAAGMIEERLTDFLKLALSSQAQLTSPEEVAWVLAYYAREAKWRVDAQAELKALTAVRGALEQALGIKFEGPKGEHFFRSTLIQTLFYGVFSSWVLWSKEHPPTSRDRFDWRLAQWSLKVPMIKALFEEVATPSKLGPLGVVEVLDWTAAALNRVDRASFFAAFQEQEAVQYFYEPFLEAFDPELRRELGVWYTPLEVVQYMVARTDEALKADLGIEDGLAGKNVYVLDPACGTGAFLVEVLKAIGRTLEAKGEDPLTAHAIKRAAIERVFGFEILPAPFVISHLQLGLVLQSIGAPFRDDGSERAGVFLTNSLTGWEPPKGPKAQLAFRELEEEREAAERVKQSTPILVVIGNPPYNGFAGVGMEEEKALVAPYRITKKAPSPQGQGLNDLYVRFFRVAERRVVEDTHRGVVCLISNYSWLDGLSHTGMRERFLDSFDLIKIDSLNGDKFKTGKVTPDGKPDPSVFSSEHNTEGIQVGTAVALLLRRSEHVGTQSISYRDFWGKDKRQELLRSLSAPEEFPYTNVLPLSAVGFPFMPRKMGATFLDWPRLPELMPTSFPGVKTSRDAFLVAMQRGELEERLASYLNPKISHREMRRLSPEVMKNTTLFNPETTRDYLRHRRNKKGLLIRYQYRPFDVRWLYWEPETKLLDRNRFEYFQQVGPENVWLSAGQRNRMADFYQPQFTTLLADHHIVESNVAMFPLLVYPQAQPNMHEPGADGLAPNLSDGARKYLGSLSASPTDMFNHTLAVLHAPAYSKENAGALRQDWPRIPLPESRNALLESARLGAELAELLNTEANLKGVTTGTICPDLKPIGNISAVRGATIDPATDLELDVGWGHSGKDGATMPGKGKAVERSYTAREREALAEGAGRRGLTIEQVIAQLGEKTVDVYLNEHAYWCNIPQHVWEYTMGGYQVIKKWLSYRERRLLGRAITPEEAHYVRDMARRIAAICLLQAHLDANYAAVKARAYPWGGAGGMGTP